MDYKAEPCAGARRAEVWRFDRNGRRPKGDVADALGVGR
jgi:hypothetical protein